MPAAEILSDLRTNADFFSLARFKRTEDCELVVLIAPVFRKPCEDVAMGEKIGVYIKLFGS